MVGTMGWVNLVLIVIMGLIYPLKMAYQRNKDKKVLELYKRARIFHPVLGFVIIGIGLTHGYLALGALRLHTGSLVLLALIAMATIALIGPRMKALRKSWRTIHRYAGGVLWAFLLLHLFYRSLI